MSVQAWFDDRRRGLLLLLSAAGKLVEMLPSWSDLGFTALAQATESTLSAANRLLNAAQQQYQKGELREALKTDQTALAIARQGGGSMGKRLHRQHSEETALSLVE